MLPGSTPHFKPRENPAMLDFYKLNNISLKLWPTILDYYFYADRSIYREMQRYETSNTDTYMDAFYKSNWKSNILRALGKDVIPIVNRFVHSIDQEIEQCRQKNSTCIQHFSRLSPRLWCNAGRQDDWERHPAFELLFIEQFLFAGVWYKDKLQPRQMDWEVIDLHVDLNIPSFPNVDMTELLCAALALISPKGGMTQGMERSLHAFCSLHQNSVNWSKVFLAVVQTNNPEVVRLVSEIAPNPGEKGEAALAEATRLDNFQAIDWLLTRRVNIWSLAETEGHSTLVNGVTES